MLQKTFIVLLSQIRVTLLAQSRAGSNEQSSVHKIESCKMRESLGIIIIGYLVTVFYIYQRIMLYIVYITRSKTFRYG